jgi:hypothetical protein
MNRRRARHLGVVTCVALYFGAAAILPVVHNAWHKRAHGHPHAPPVPSPRGRILELPFTAPHVHGHGPRAAHPRVHRHSQAPLRRQPPPLEVPSDPRHSERAPEHFGVAIGPGPDATTALHLTLSPSERLCADTTVFQDTLLRSTIQARGPPIA